MSVPLEHDYIGLSDASSLERSSESSNFSSDNLPNTLFNLKATELSLGLPGFSKNSEENAKFGPIIKNYMSGAKRGFSDVNINGGSEAVLCKVINGVFEKDQTQQLISSPDVKPVEGKKKGPVGENGSVPSSAKAQVVGWPPIRSFRKNTMATNLPKSGDVAECNSGSGESLCEVSMDGAPYLRKIDLKIYHNYAELSKALEKRFSCFTLGQCASNGIKGGEGLGKSNLKHMKIKMVTGCLLVMSLGNVYRFMHAIEDNERLRSDRVSSKIDGEVQDQKVAQVPNFNTERGI